MFIVNRVNSNRYLESNGTTIRTSSYVGGHLYHSPVAKKINYYKDRLYVADYVFGDTRYKNGIMRSSMPVGIVSLVDGDHDAGSTSIKITDTDYVHGEDVLDIYRGNTLKESITVKNKAEDSITVDAISSELKSSDELWVSGTYSGSKVFRWADNSASGINVKQYDTFKLAGGRNDRIRMLTNIGDVMMIANTNNLGIWNNYEFASSDLGIGCVSDQGYVKALGTLWFIHYTGIYSTTGGTPKLMSGKVEKYIEGAATAGLEVAAAGRKGMSIFFAIGDVTLYNPDGSTDRELTDVVLEYNLRQENWYVFTGIDAKYFATYIASDNADRLEFAGDTGNVYELFRGTKDDNTYEIPMEIATSSLNLSSSFEKIGYPKEITIETERGSGIKCFVSLDNEPYYELKGEAIKGCTIIPVSARDEDDSTPPRCRNISISLREYSKRLCKISRMAIDYLETDEEEYYRK